jgi:hypothetical protein
MAPVVNPPQFAAWLRLLSRSRHAVLVIFWICHNDPGDFLLTNVNPGSPEFLEALNLDFLIVRVRVDVESVLSSFLS